MGSGGLLKVKMSRMNQDHSWQTLVKIMKHKAKCVRSGGACELIWCHHGLCHYICHQHQRERGRERESSLHSSVEPELYPNNAYDVPWVDYQALALRRPCFGAHQHSLYKPTFPQV
ncbi:hypothetical protein JHK82_050742 [Glycine max]|nr:hypothetical protein JHK82_050742 [Glycine max]